MEYAVIKTGGKQYRVKRGDTLEVDKLPVEKDKTVSFENVLLWVSNGEVKVGTPAVANVKVKAKVLDQIKGEKIHVRKFKAKVRYRRVMGFRPLLTRVQIEKIESGKVKTAKAAASSQSKTSNVTKIPIKRSHPKTALPKVV